jgi:cobyrinic acid a,c-diamide synthase
MHGFYVSAAHKSSGKTTLSIGLCAALTRKGYRVQPFKKGPDYIDPLWLSQAAGNACYNLDFHCQESDEIVSLFQSQSLGNDVALVEGNKGLYDGMDITGSDANAALAKLLSLPVVLVLDVRGVTRGIAPLLMGYQAFDPEIQIAGVILNQVAGARQEGKIRQVVEHYTDIPVIGAVSRDPQLVIEERHLGLVPSNESADAERRIHYLADKVLEQVDVEALIRTSRQWQPETSPPADQPVNANVRLGIAQDAAFGFYYADDLRRFTQLGVSLVPFSPLSDKSLPEVDALFLGGGFPETHMATLAANQEMLADVRRFIASGGPAYAECGGLMYLCQSLSWRGQTERLAGVIDADVEVLDKPQGRGYVRLEEAPAHPWPGGTVGTLLAVHEFHYSRLRALPDGGDYAFRVLRGEGLGHHRDGLVQQNLLAGYAHQRQVRNNLWVNRFVEFIKLCKDGDTT